MQTDPTTVAGTREVIPSKEVEPTNAATEPPPERLTSIDALRGFDMFWIVGGDDVARVLCKWWGTPEAKQLRRTVRARRMGRVPVLRPDLPALPVHGRRGLAVLVAEVHDAAITRRVRRLGRTRAAGRAACSCWD